MGASPSSPAEALSTTLLTSVFLSPSSSTIDMEKVTLLIWEQRNSPDMVSFISNFLANYSGEKLVFDGIEFYLPQLAHMIIHLEVDWPSSTLEQFALVISQHSLHFALQFNWILVCALEDYQPETAAGEPNPTYNETFYTRCIKLLQNMERCVVYGTPRAPELRKLYEMGEISKTEFESMELADRRFNAFQIVDSPTHGTERRGHDQIEISYDDSNSGYLLYKRGRRRKYRRKPWKKRFFVVAERMLFCYDRPGGTLRRAMPLESAIVEQPEGGSRHENYFEVHNQNYQFLIRGEDEAQVDKWVNMLSAAAKSAALFSMSLGSGDNTQALLSQLPPDQLARYQFFKGERDFVRSLCDIAEELRFEPREDRKKLAPELIAETPIPPCAYVPMCKSTDQWQRVVRNLPNECRVFSTKERCPVLMSFEMEREEEATDVAEYLHTKFEYGVGGDETDAADAAEAQDEARPLTLPPEAPAARKSFFSASPPPAPEPEPYAAPASTGGKKTPFTSLTALKKSVAAASPFTKNSASKGPAKFQARSPVNSSKKHGLWKDAAASEIESNSSNQSGAAASGKSPGKDKKSVMNARVNKLLKEMPQIKMPKALSALKKEKKEVKIDYKKVKIYKSCSDAGIDQSEISEAGINGAKRYVCGGETWADKCERLQAGNTDPRLQLHAVIAKSNDDVRQEVYIMQMIHFYQSVFKEEGLPLFLKPYKILATSRQTGLIELLKDSTSIDGLKKSDGYPTEGGLRAYFEAAYGSPDSEDFIRAQ
ncbi:hypothetical protein TeGR_g935, partial [Tetraparma gracilis]